MTEAQFDAQVRLWLHKRYFPWGVWENNKTGYGEAYHAPFGGKGGADLVGALGPLRIEIEVKSKHGKQKPEQKLRQERINKPWGGLYVVCREVGRLTPCGCDAGFRCACGEIEEHFVQWLGWKRLFDMKLHPW
jgi:hypothetical protein